MRLSHFCFYLLLLFPATFHAQTPTKILLDADTGNEIDDLFAVARALVEPSWDIVALTATQWQTSLWAQDQTMENSHRINSVLVGYLKVPVPTLRGGVNRMFDWGDQAQHSAAAYEIIKQAKAMPEGEKLTVVALGALTNVASAIYIDSTIESKIRLYWLGTNFDSERDLIYNTDFNCVMDIQAFYYLFNSSVEMHVMPHSLALKMEFNYAETEKRLREVHPLGAYLCDRWYNHLDGLRYDRWIWDLAVVSAAMHPDWAEERIVQTPPQLGEREVYYYTDLDGGKVREDFFTTLIEAMEKL